MATVAETGDDRKGRRGRAQRLGPEGEGFWQAPNALFGREFDKLGTHGRLLYCALCRHAYGDRTCRVGHRILMKDIGTRSYRTFARALAALEAAGWVKTTHRVSRGVDGAANAYELLPPPVA